jgi:circadian clock protein KaiC
MTVTSGPGEPGPLTSAPLASTLPDRLYSGIGGLDTLLCGGFVRNGIYIIHGAPGAGKTILSNQICYAHAAAGGHALYVTLLSEQHDRLLANLAQLAFCDQSRIAREIHYVSAFQLLERDGLAGLLTLLRREIMAHAAGILVLDGLVAAEAYATTELELKKFIHELQMLASAADCTMFLLTSAGHMDEASEQRPEHTMVDGMIALRETTYGWRMERDIHVRKVRGSDHLPGRHAMQITSAGIMVWPRTEALPAASPAENTQGDAPRLATGIAGLDQMLGGGLPAGSSTVVLGPTGAGKTSLALNFLARSTPAEPGLMVSFYESPDHLLARASGFAPDLGPRVADGVIGFAWHGQAEGLIDRIAFELLADVRRRGVRRVVIDGLLGFEGLALPAERLPRFFLALTGQLRAMGVTTLCTLEIQQVPGTTHRAPVDSLTPIAENLILLRHVERAGRLERNVSVMKLRGSAFDSTLRAFEIGPGGIVLVTAFGAMDNFRQRSPGDTTGG